MSVITRVNITNVTLGSHGSASLRDNGSFSIHFSVVSSDDFAPVLSIGVAVIMACTLDVLTVFLELTF